MHLDMLYSTSTSILALALPSVIHARALSKKSIEWNPCSELNKNITAAIESAGPVAPFECGTISVPLDYTDSNSPPLDLNLFRVKATKEPVLGTVLYNPGGPGGQGADSLPPTASDLRANIGDQYHIVSWDPRGTGYTIPFNCSGFDEGTVSPPQKRDIEDVASPNLTETFLAGGWDLAGQSAEACVAPANETGRLIGTAFTARDMLAIVDALCEDGLLRYYGVSYGTVLGSYFAAMFPDRVERMVLDGNLDPADYRDGTWGDSLRDTEKTLNAFLEACIDNKDECLLASFLEADTSQELFGALNLVMESLVANITADLTDDTTYLAYIGLKGIIFKDLYYPSKWPALADSVVAYLNATADDSAAGNESESSEPAWQYGKAVNAIQGIMAADATFKPKSAEEYLPIVEFQGNLSGFSDIWYFRTWVAAQWKLPAKERFYGEFKATTKHPILYVNGEYDPVTPLEAARRASKGFEGSVVLAHNGKGHTVLADPSTCVQNHVQAYFRDGVLPGEDEQCESDLEPWALAKARNGKSFGPLSGS